LVAEDQQHSIGDFLDADRPHAAEINRTFAKKTWAAFDMMPKNDVTVAKWASESGLR
jgi:hypothetical protein